MFSRTSTCSVSSFTGSVMGEKNSSTAATPGCPTHIVVARAGRRSGVPKVSSMLSE
jgi:hypothetical protein